MDTYYITRTDQDEIELAKMIWNICPLQDDEKEEIMSVVETNMQVYLLYQAPYNSNEYYLEAFKAHLKVREVHKVAVVYNPGLEEFTIQENNYTTSNTATK